MAKRTTHPSHASDSAATPPAKTRARRSGTPAPEADIIAASPDVERSENDDAVLNAASGDEQPASALSAQPAASGSSSTGLEPNEEDIRMRAYHRYLERGSGHGTDFQDWLEAERELKQTR